MNICTAESVKGNNSSYHSEHCGGSLHDCQFPDMEWLMDSEINRMLADQISGIYISKAASGNAKKAAVSCGHGNAYNSCLPDKNTAHHDHKENCGGLYNQNRACPHS